MTLSLTLPRELEDELSAEARRQGLPLPEYALRVLAAHVHSVPGSGAREAASTGAEVVAYWRREGLVGTRPEIADPSEHARARTGGAGISSSNSVDDVIERRRRLRTSNKTLSHVIARSDATKQSPSGGSSCGDCRTPFGRSQ